MKSPRTQYHIIHYYIIQQVSSRNIPIGTPDYICPEMLNRLNESEGIIYDTPKDSKDNKKKDHKDNKKDHKNNKDNKHNKDNKNNKKNVKSTTNEDSKLPYGYQIYIMIIIIDIYFGYYNRYG